MNEQGITSKPVTPIPPDDPKRSLAIARPNTDQRLPHIGLVGNTYTILFSGDDTGGRYCLIDMHIPPGGARAGRAFCLVIESFSIPRV